MLESSPEVNEIFPAIIAAQGDFPAVSKTAENPFFHSKYADIAAIVNTIGPIARQHGLGVIQFPSNVNGQPSLKTFVIHTSGQWIGGEMMLMLAKDDPQGQGSGITYGRRYAYSPALGVVTEEDDDGNAATSQRVEQVHQQAPARQSHPAPAGVVYLDVPFKDKEEVKDRGARWDAEAKSWYIPQGVDPADFSQWGQKDVS